MVTGIPSSILIAFFIGVSGRSLPVMSKELLTPRPSCLKARHLPRGLKCSLYSHDTELGASVAYAAQLLQRRSLLPPGMLISLGSSSNTANWMRESAAAYIPPPVNESCLTL
ncbi:hypothetical protein HDK77DRAFT_153395 [Phyllosticta capitalensis]|uniref:Uncharacterized protein n=1 Tax=Phyllosticta capitalensis TaxID=121624 RepID=A0ABR1YUG1_9PEZI